MHPAGYLSRSEWEDREHWRAREDELDKQEIERRRRAVLEAEGKVFEGELGSVGSDYGRADDVYRDYMDHQSHYRQKYADLLESINRRVQYRNSTMSRFCDELVS